MSDREAWNVIDDIRNGLYGARVLVEDKVCYYRQDQEEDVKRAAFMVGYKVENALAVWWKVGFPDIVRGDLVKMVEDDIEEIEFTAELAAIFDDEAPDTERLN